MTYLMSNLMYKPVLDETSVISVFGSGNMGFSLAVGFSKFFKVLFYNSSQEKPDPVCSDESVIITRTTSL